MAEYTADIFLEGFVPLFCTTISVSVLGVLAKYLSRTLQRSRSVLSRTPAPVTDREISRRGQWQKALLLFGDPGLESIPNVDAQLADYNPPPENTLVDDFEGIVGEGHDSEEDNNLHDSHHEAARQSRRTGSVSRFGFRPDEEGEEIDTDASFDLLSTFCSVEIPLPEEDSSANEDRENEIEDFVFGFAMATGKDLETENEYHRSFSSDLSQITQRETSMCPGKFKARESDDFVQNQPEDFRQGSEGYRSRKANAEAVLRSSPAYESIWQLIDPSSEEGERIISNIRTFMHFPEHMDTLEVILSIAHDRDTIFKNLRYVVPFTEGIPMSPQHDARFRSFEDNLYSINWKKVFEADSGSVLQQLLEQRPDGLDDIVNFLTSMDNQRTLDGDKRKYAQSESANICNSARRGGLRARGIISPMRNIMNLDDVNQEQALVEQQDHKFDDIKVQEKGKCTTEENFADLEGDMEVSNSGKKGEDIHAKSGTAVLNNRWAEDHLLDGGDLHILRLEMDNSIKLLDELDGSLHRSIDDINKSMEIE